MSWQRHVNVYHGEVFQTIFQLQHCCNNKKKQLNNIVYINKRQTLVVRLRHALLHQNHQGSNTLMRLLHHQVPNNNIREGDLSNNIFKCRCRVKFPLQNKFRFRISKQNLLVFICSILTLYIIQFIFLFVEI